MPARRPKPASPAAKPPATGRPVDPLPARIAPMLAESGRPFDSPRHLFEVKWDGMRCVVLRGADTLRLLNRNDVDVSPRYPELACLERLPPGTALDGEIVVLDQGRPSFHKLQQRLHLTQLRDVQLAAERVPATYIAFDLLYRDGQNLMPQPLADRRRQLTEVIAALADAHVIAPDHVLEHGQQFFESAARLGLEGIMAKRLDSPYLPGKRSGAWIKIKCATTGEFELLGYTQRAGEETLSAVILGAARPDGWEFLGKAGTGFTEAARRELFRLLQPLPPLPRPPADGPKDAQWRLTGRRCRIRYLEVSPNGKLRGPVFEGLVAGTSAAPAAPDAAPRKSSAKGKPRA